MTATLKIGILLPADFWDSVQGQDFPRGSSRVPPSAGSSTPLSPVAQPRVPGEHFGGSGGSGVRSGCRLASPPTSSIKSLQRQQRGRGRGRAGAMAEGRSGSAGLFARQVQKRFSRAQEKVRRWHPAPNPSFAWICPPCPARRSLTGPHGSAQHLWVLRGWEFGGFWGRVILAPRLWRVASPRAPQDTLASLMLGGFTPNALQRL